MSPLEAAKCNICDVLYHRVCAALPTSVAVGQINKDWSCPECKKKVAKKTNPGTPMSGLSPNIQSKAKFDDEIPGNSPLSYTAQDSDSSPDIATLLQTFKDELRKELGSMLREELDKIRADFQGEFHKLHAEMAEIRAFNDSLKESVKTCNDRVDAMDRRMASFEERVSKDVDVDEAISQLKLEINERDQQLLATELEVVNLPEQSSENLVHTIKVMATKLGIKIEDRDIVSVDRVGGRQLNATSAVGPQARPRAVVVRLARRDLRDELLHGARVRRGATSADLGMSGPPQRFYVNERLTKMNRLLFRRARDAGQRIGWQFVWTKHGRILARHKHDDRACLIRTEADILRIFGTDVKCTQ